MRYVFILMLLSTNCFADDYYFMHPIKNWDLFLKDANYSNYIKTTRLAQHREYLSGLRTACYSSTAFKKTEDCLELIDKEISEHKSRIDTFLKEINKASSSPTD